MARLTREELAQVGEAIDGVVTKLWPNATSAGSTDAALATLLWTAAVDSGWTGLAGDGALDAAVAAAHRLGRLACPLPLLDAYVAAELLGGDAAEAIGGGEIRPIVAANEVDAQQVRFAEFGPAVTHVALLDTNRIVLRAVIDCTSTPGLAAPAWSDLTLADHLSAQARPGPAAVDRAKVILRLGLTARAIGAAERAWELSVAHAQDRIAFGQPIGSFQAVSHRAADGATDLAAARGLIDQAVGALLLDSPDAVLAAELAVAFGGPAAIRVQFAAQHTLAAIGYFDEHEAPWLFRRVNSDAARVATLRPAAGEVADQLVESDASLPMLELGPQAEQFRREVRDFTARHSTAAAVVHLDDHANSAMTNEAKQRGYVTMSWPKSYGGADASVEEQTVLGEELGYARVNLRAKVAADMFGTSVIRHGSAEQQRRLLPLIAAGNFPFYLGYSEPEVGSDLANLRMRAVRDGDGWVVNGCKMWGTSAHTAEWVWLATRTDPEATPKQAGITVFLTRVDRPGFLVQQHRALSGEISCTTFFDDFRIPDADRVGEVNGGWKVITSALAQERIIMANVAAAMHRLLDDLLAELRADPATSVGPRGSAHRALITDIAARLQAARVLVKDSVRASATTTGGARLEAPMAKILASQLFEDFGEAALRILGPAAALGEGCPEVPGRGAFEYNLRYSIMHVIGGGTIDIQRNLVARSLGLGRSAKAS